MFSSSTKSITTWTLNWGPAHVNDGYSPLVWKSWIYGAMPRLNGGQPLIQMLNTIHWFKGAQLIVLCPNLYQSCFVGLVVWLYLPDADGCSKEHMVWDLPSWRKPGRAVTDCTSATSPLEELLPGYDLNRYSLSIRSEIQKGYFVMVKGMPPWSGTVGFCLFLYGIAQIYFQVHHWCVVFWWTQYALWRQVSCGTSHVSAIGTPLWWIFKSVL